MLPVKNLFVLYTGGTIGMLQTPQGLAPAGGFEARMRDHLQSLGDAPDLRWRFAELQPPLDSANMTQGNWLAMRDAIVAALDAGAYGFVMSSSYNQRPRAAEVLITSDGTPKLIRRRETLDDLTRCFVEE